MSTSSFDLCCPRCGAALQDLSCACGAAYSERDGVLDLYRPGAGSDEAMTERVRGFYEERPFPDYRPDDDRGSLLRRGRANPFTRALDEHIPPRARVVELGCGTSQMALFLGLAGRPVVGIDLSMASLQLGESFRQKAGIQNVRLVRGDLFAPPLAPRCADVVISNGVLHHTPDARAGFAAMARLVAPGGYAVLGLYNRWGRLLLPLLRSRHAEEARTGRRAAAWFNDQHQHPRETRHTVDEVLGWLTAEGLDFVSASPSIVPGQPAQANPFEPTDPGGRVGHLFAQLSWLGRAEDGGLWVTVARRPAE